MSTEFVAAKMGAGVYAHQIERACIRWGLEFALEKAHFIGQLSVESAGFSSVVESMNYSVDGLLRTFGRHRISEADARKYGRAPGRPADQRAIANLVYGGAWGRTNLGNTQPEDGWRLRGHGLKQVTGRSNFRRCSLALFGDERLLNTPALLMDPEWAAQSGGWYWSDKKIGQWAMKDDTLAVSRAVNLGTATHGGTPNGLPERIKATDRAKTLFLSIIK